MKSRHCWHSVLERLEDRHLLASVTLFPTKDNSLFQDVDGLLSNGSGDYLFVGKTAQNDDAKTLRRALVQFDVSSIPFDAEITSVSLSMNVSKIPPGNQPQPAALHRVLSSWGEGQSNAPGDEGRGTTAIGGDATWLHRVFPVTRWDTEGGDFFVNPSATIDLDSVGQHTWSADRMIDDVTRWVQTPGQNFGWIIIGNEVDTRSAKRLDSRENPTEENRPQLTIEYTEAGDDIGISIANADIREGNSGQQPLDFEVTISEDAEQTVSVDYSTVSGSATAGDDFVSTQGTLTFNPGDARTKIISVPILGDTLDEADEQFTVVLSNPNGVEITDDTATGVIINDDTPGALSVSDETIVEGNDGIQTVTVTFSLSSASGDSQAFTYVTVPETATPQQDFVPAGGQLVFEPGETRKTVDIQIIGDTLFEDDETFFVRITGIAGAIFGTITIENDDAPNPTPWHNVDFPEDVNGDGRVVPFDALFIINELNGAGIGVGSGELPNPPGDLTPPPYLDVTGDNFLAPLDALRVINFINSGAAAVAAVADVTPENVAPDSISPRLTDIAIAAIWDEGYEDSLKKKSRTQ